MKEFLTDIFQPGTLQYTIANISVLHSRQVDPDPNQALSIKRFRILIKESFKLKENLVMQVFKCSVRFPLSNYYLASLAICCTLYSMIHFSTFGNVRLKI